MYIPTVISRVFDPLIVATLLVALAFWVSGLDGMRAVTLFTGVYLLTTVLPALLLFGAIRKRRIKNWDLSDRRERIAPMGIELCLLLASSILVYCFGNRFLFYVYMAILVWFFGFFLITLLWKISGHAATGALAAGLILRWFGWQFWPVLVAVALVAWARVVRKDHTVTQVVGGVFYSAVFLCIGIVAGYL